MCSTCGCNDPKNRFTLYTPDGKHQHHGHHHDHGPQDHVHDSGQPHNHAHGPNHHHDHSHHDHPHPTSQESEQERRINLETNILTQNNLMAERNRGYFEGRSIFSLNLMSSPGSGKTSLLEKTITDLNNLHHFYVIEGDQQTTQDAERVKKTGAPVVQINTGQGCHLDADMVNHALKELNPVEGAVLIIENVGNLVCPSLFDLGEQKRVVVMSVTEGEDKPLKYPTMFQSAQLCIINKTDLLPYLKFNMEQAHQYIKQVNHSMEILEVSVYSGEGMRNWYEWLSKSVKGQ